MIYNVGLVSGVQQSDSVIHIHISILCRRFSHIGYYRIVSRIPVLDSRSLLVIYFVLRYKLFVLRYNRGFTNTTSFND